MYKNKVGVIGSGQLASMMVARLIEVGHFVIVLNDKGIADKNINVITSSSPSDIGNICKIILTVVEDSTCLEDVLLGARGIISSRRKDNIVIDMSPVSPEFIQEIAEKFIEMERYFLDAAYVDAKRIDGNSVQMILVGGEKSVYEKACPILQSLAEAVEHIGGHGASQFHRQAFAIRTTKSDK